MTAQQPAECVYRLPATLPDDLKKLASMVEDFKAGRITEPQFKAFRVPQGVYEQRELNYYMLRVRFPAGGALPQQMRLLAAVARKYGAEHLHVTTRQDIQVHKVPLDAMVPALEELLAGGLSTKGGGGNTVRNISACPRAGLCLNDRFDVAPCAVAVTEFLLPDPANYQLPRKYKIAFSGCSVDCAGTAVNDLGFVAKLRGEERGFAVYAGGGMGASTRVGQLLEDFVPIGEAHLVAEAVKRVFDKHGNRKNRHKARLRFLVDGVGFERFREMYQEELSALRAAPPPPPEIRPLPEHRHEPPAKATEPAEGFDEWKRRNVAPQKQEGYCMAHVPLRLGDIHVDAMEKLADAVEAHGEGTARTTQAQNIVLRWVHENELPSLHRALKDIGLAEAPPPLLRDLTACAGASTCKLGICLSRGLAEAVWRKLERDGLDLGAFADLKILISGCPNSCGRHPVADIGFFGAARRIGGHLVPHYVFQLGGRVGEKRTRLAEGKTPVPARAVPDFLRQFLAAFAASPQFPDYEAYLANGGRDEAERLAEPLKAVPPFDEDKNYYFDWSADELFSLAGRGPGECGAGVFELIEVDLATARDSLDAERLVAAVVAASRALLVTQGLEAESDAHAVKLFAQHFADAGLVAPAFRGLLDLALKAMDAGDEEGDLAPDEVSTFVQAVQDLYDSMDSSLRFQPGAKAAPEASSEPTAPPPAEVAEPASDAAADCDKEADFRGVACPLNFVKTKLLLETMQSGQTLGVLLNDEGAKNVPDSVRQEGHEVLSLEQQGEHWRLTVRRK